MTHHTTIWRVIWQERRVGGPRDSEWEHNSEPADDREDAEWNARRLSRYVKDGLPGLYVGERKEFRNVQIQRAQRTDWQDVPLPQETS